MKMNDTANVPQRDEPENPLFARAFGFLITGQKVRDLFPLAPEEEILNSFAYEI